MAEFASEPEELDRIVEEITDFLTNYDSHPERDGVVVEISGGLNSAVTTMLAADALGADRVFGLLLPAYMSTEADALTAELVAKGLGIEYSKVQLLPFVHLFHELSVPDVDPPHDTAATANAIDRIRMACTYYAAETMDRLVLGTENRTDWLLGAITKYGVQRGDLLPLGDLYWTEVRNLAQYMGIPDGVWHSPGSHGSPSEMLDAEVDPTMVDEILRHLVDADEEIGQTAGDLDVDVSVVKAVAERHAQSRHQRILPPTPKSMSAGQYDNFHEIELRFD